MNCATHNDTAAVAFCRTCGKPLCNQCTRDVRGVIYCEACLAARMEGAPAPGTPPGYRPVPPPPPQTGYQQFMDQGLGIKAQPGPASGPNPTVAGILAGFFPFGVGAVYTGQYAKGLSHLVIMVLLILGLGSDLPWFIITMLAIGTGFFYLYQIIDSVRTAKAIQLGQPAPDPFGLAQTFGAGEKFEATKVPIGAAILFGLGLLFLVNTVFDFSLHRFWPLILIALGCYIFAKQWGLLGNYRPYCMCDRCRTRKLMGPAILVTIGVLSLLESMTHLGFNKTWPAILLVIGVVKLMQSNASGEGHVAPLPPAGFAPPSGAAGFPPPPVGFPPATPPTAPPDATASTPGSSSGSGEVNNV